MTLLHPAQPRPSPSLLGRLKRLVMRGLMGLMLVGMITAAQPARAQWAVFDASVFAQTLSTASTVIETLKQAQQAYLFANAVYSVVKDPTAFGFVQILDMAQLPIFNGITGIDDLRDFATLTDMTVSELQALFSEFATIQRLMNDPSYRASQTRATLINLMAQASARERARKTAMATAMQQEQKSLNALAVQATKLGNQIQAAANANPVNAGAIAAYQAQLALIQIQEEDLKSGLWAVIKNSETKKEQDEETYQNNMREAGLLDPNTQIYNSMFLVRQLTGVTWSNQP